MKTYKHISRFKVRRRVPKQMDGQIRWALSLQPGDIINDCTSLNVVIRKIKAQIYPVNNGWYIYDVDFETEPFGGRCSLMNCGVSPAKSRDLLEKEYLGYLTEYMTGDAPGSAAYWFGGRGKEDFKKAEKRYLDKLDVIKNDGHFLDEHGVLLPAFRY